MTGSSSTDPTGSRRARTDLVAPQRFWVFAVEHDSAQLTWKQMGPGEVTIATGAVTTTVNADGGPGSVVLRGLEPATRYSLRVRGSTAAVPDRGLRRRFSTLPRPPGEELFRFATVSDLHLGETHFGYFGTMEEQPKPIDPYPVRAFRSALVEAHNWGAQLLVVKGDCTNDSRIDEWEVFGKLLAESGLPWHAVPGNHDTRPVRRELTPSEKFWNLARGGVLIKWFGRHPERTGRPVTSLEGFRHVGYEPPQPVSTVDVEGLRIVLADTTTRAFHLGSLREVTGAIVDAVADAASVGIPSFVAAHHYPMPLPVPHFWPPGLPADEAGTFFPRLAAAAKRPGSNRPSVLYSAGHAHRHRKYERAGVTCTEVGSPKDYPGTWAGYIVFETGITQVVRRVAAPDMLRWNDFSGGAAFGLWKLWSPGLRPHRCFHHPWD